MELESFIEKVNPGTYEKITKSLQGVPHSLIKKRVATKSTVRKDQISYLQQILAHMLAL